MGRVRERAAERAQPLRARERARIRPAGTEVVPRRRGIRCAAVVRCGVCSDVRDRRGGAAGAADPALGRELRVRREHGAARDAEVARQRPRRRETGAFGEAPVANRSAEGILDPLAHARARGDTEEELAARYWPIRLLTDWLFPLGHSARILGSCPALPPTPTRLRALHVPGPAARPAERMDVSSARAVADAGFPVVATSSAAVNKALGFARRRLRSAARGDDRARSDRERRRRSRHGRRRGRLRPPADELADCWRRRRGGCNLEDSDHRRRRPRRH